MARTSRDSREVVSRIAENLEMLWRKVCTLKDPGTWVSHLGLSHLAWGSWGEDEVFQNESWDTEDNRNREEKNSPTSVQKVIKH